MMHFLPHHKQCLDHNKHRYRTTVNAEIHTLHGYNACRSSCTNSNITVPSTCGSSCPKLLDSEGESTSMLQNV